MSNKFEFDMPTFPQKQFPAGDILPRNVEMARQLQASLVVGNREQQLNQLQMLRRTEIPSWEYMLSQTTNNAGLKYLCDAWSGVLSNSEVGSALVRTGLYSTLAFVNKSHLLPTKFSDFSEELLVMSSHDEATIEQFANYAWEGMERIHPDIYGVLASFVDHLLAVNDISPEYKQETNLLRAGAAIPYLLAAATRAENYLQIELKPEGRWLKVINEIDMIQASLDT